MRDTQKQPTEAQQARATSQAPILELEKVIGMEGYACIGQPKKDGLYQEGCNQSSLFSTNQEGCIEELAEFEDAVKVVLKNAGQELERRGFSIQHISLEVKAVSAPEDFNFF